MSERWSGGDIESRTEDLAWPDVFRALLSVVR